MDFLLEALTNWLKEMLVGGILSNLSGMFDSVNQQVADISLNASREVTIPLAFSKCEETGRYTNFVNAAHPSLPNSMILASALKSSSCCIRIVYKWVDTCFV